MRAIDARARWRPKMRFIHGYWRVTAVPMKFDRLTREQQRAWVKAHDHAHKLNAQPGRGLNETVTAEFVVYGPAPGGMRFPGDR